MKKLLTYEQFNENQTTKTDQWWKKYTKYQLSAYPNNIPEKDVEIDLSGDIDTHPVMTWISPTTGKKIYAYTKARMEAQKEKKYDRLVSLTDEQVEQIKAKCHEDILTSDSENKKQAAAVICIIAQTGLRPGSRHGFFETKNRGVMTLSRDNVTVKGEDIELNFIGKSYKENVAKIVDGVLAHYLEERMKEGDDFIFSISKDTVDSYYKNVLGMKNFKIKDLRTYTAGKIAKWFLENDKTPPPPVPTKSSEIKKVLKNKLKLAFEYVSNKLNNTPAMAKNSYIDPRIIENWMKNLGIQAEAIAESRAESSSKPIKFKGNAPLYDLPEWWDNDDIELSKIEK